MRESLRQQCLCSWGSFHLGHWPSLPDWWKWQLTKVPYDAWNGAVSQLALPPSTLLLIPQTVDHMLPPLGSWHLYIVHPNTPCSQGHLPHQPGKARLGLWITAMFPCPTQSRCLISFRWMDEVLLCRGWWIAFSSDPLSETQVPLLILICQGWDLLVTFRNPPVLVRIWRRSGPSLQKLSDPLSSGDWLWGLQETPLSSCGPSRIPLGSGSYMD